jgi:hypothetical protein
MKEKEKDFDTLASDILIELYNDIKEHETDLMEEGNLDAAQDEMIRLAQSGENPHTALPGVARKHGIDVAVLKKAIFGENEEEDENLSAKKARAGKDIGKPGKNFAKIAKSAGEKYGSKAAGKRVAGAVLAKMRGKR